MGLYERWTADDETKLRIHPFASSLREMSRGAITRAQVISGFNLAGDEITELDAMISHYNGLNAGAKDRYIVILHDVMILAEDTQTRVLYTRAFCKSRLGF